MAGAELVVPGAGRMVVVSDGFGKRPHAHSWLIAAPIRLASCVQQCASVHPARGLA